MAETTQLILETVVKGTETARKSLNDTTKWLDTMTAATKKNSDGFKTLAVAATVAFTAVVALGTGAVNQASKMQDLRQSFDTLLGSADKGKKLFLDIQKMAAATPFTSADLASATSTMLGFGVAEEKVLPMMKQLGDISMGNADRFQHLSLAFAQVSAAGKLTGQDLLQMVNAGFNPLQEMSKTTGKSISELKDEMAKGAITTKMVEDAMAGATSESGRFFGGMGKASKTFSGVMSTLKDNIGITLAAIGGFANGEVVQWGLLDMLTKGMQKAMPYLDQFTKWASEPAHAELLKNIILIVAGVTGLVAGMVALGAIIGPIRIAFAALTSPVSIVIGVVALLTAGLIWLWFNSDKVVNGIKAGWDWLVGQLSASLELIKMGFSAAWEWITGKIDLFMKAVKLVISAGMTIVKTAWDNMWKGLGDAVVAAWEFAKNTVKNSINWVLEKINAVIDGINWIASAGESIGISVPKIPNIPYLAEGGIVTRPTVAMIGEAWPEAVIPLSKMNGGGRMGWGITINITGMFGQGVAEEIWDMIVTKLARASYI